MPQAWDATASSESVLRTARLTEFESVKQCVQKLERTSREQLVLENETQHVLESMHADVSRLKQAVRVLAYAVDEEVGTVRKECSEQLAMVRQECGEQFGQLRKEYAELKHQVIAESRSQSLLHASIPSKDRAQLIIRPIPPVPPCAVHPTQPAPHSPACPAQPAQLIPPTKSLPLPVGVSGAAGTQAGESERADAACGRSALEGDGEAGAVGAAAAGTELQDGSGTFRDANLSRAAEPVTGGGGVSA